MDNCSDEPDRVRSPGGLPVHIAPGANSTGRAMGIANVSRSGGVEDALKQIKSRKPVCKPGFVPGLLLATIISLGRRLLAGSCGLPEGGSGPDQSSPPIWPCSRWGLPSRPVARPLVGSYPAISPLPVARRYLFCGTFPILGQVAPALGRWTLSITASCGARTFLPPVARRAIVRPTRENFIVQPRAATAKERRNTFTMSHRSP